MVMEEIGSVLGGLMGGGGSLVDVSEHDPHVEVDPNVTVTDSHSSSNYSSTTDDHESNSHNTTIVYQQAESHQEVTHGGGGHHAHFDPEVYEMQKHLKEEGFDPGALDGMMGAHTQHALVEEESYEMHHEHQETGRQSHEHQGHPVPPESEDHQPAPTTGDDAY